MHSAFVMLISSSRARISIFLAVLVVVLVAFLPKETLTQKYRSYYDNSPHEMDSLDSTQGNKTNRVIFMLVAPSRIHQATLALLNVENRFNRRFQYPYVLFTASEEESAMITEEEKRKIDWITQGRAKFGMLFYFFILRCRMLKTNSA